MNLMETVQNMSALAGIGIILLGSIWLKDYLKRVVFS